MNDWYERAAAELARQQALVEVGTTTWLVAEQLKEICKREPKSAELIARDLENQAMSITEAEKKVSDYADKHRNGKRSCGVSGMEADRILREFYGLPAVPAGRDPGSAPDRSIVDLSDYL